MIEYINVFLYCVLSYIEGYIKNFKFNQKCNQEIRKYFIYQQINNINVYNIKYMFFLVLFQVWNWFV